MAKDAQIMRLFLFSVSHSLLGLLRLHIGVRLRRFINMLCVELIGVCKSSLGHFILLFLYDVCMLQGETWLVQTRTNWFL